MLFNYTNYHDANTQTDSRASDMSLIVHYLIRNRSPHNSISVKIVLKGRPQFIVSYVL